MVTFLKKLRQKNNVSQEFLAKKIGVSRPTYVQIENGGRKMLVEEAQKLADFFELSLDDFLKNRENPVVRVKIEKSSKNKKLENNNQEMRISIPQERAEKFKEVLLYILERIGARPNVGEAVICKILYFIDFDFYEKFEEQLMGAKYIKNHHGPTPAVFLSIVGHMERDGDLIRVKQKYFQHNQKKYLPLRKANLSNFSAEEKDFIDKEIERFKDFNATEMEKYSHRDVPWIGADNLQPIDYEAVFSRTDEFSVRKYDED